MNLTLMPITTPGKISITFIIISIALVISVILIAMNLELGLFLQRLQKIGRMTIAFIINRDKAPYIIIL